MITVGSVKREDAVLDFPFLAESFRGWRKAIKDFTRLTPDYVFWIYPDGKLLNAKNSHKKNPPKGFEHILQDEPDYGGFFRGHVASNYGRQIIVVYCRPEALASTGEKLDQFLRGIDMIPIPIDDDVLVISDNADIYGTLDDLRQRNI